MYCTSSIAEGQPPLPFVVQAAQPAGGRPRRGPPRTRSSGYASTACWLVACVSMHLLGRVPRSAGRSARARGKGGTLLRHRQGRGRICQHRVLAEAPHAHSASAHDTERPPRITDQGMTSPAVTAFVPSYARPEKSLLLAILASWSIRRFATSPAFESAVQSTLAGSMTPARTRSS